MHLSVAQGGEVEALTRHTLRDDGPDVERRSPPTSNKALQKRPLSAMVTNVHVGYPLVRQEDEMNYQCKGGKVKDVTSEWRSIMLEVIHGLERGHCCRHAR